MLADTDDPVEVVLAQAKNQVLFHLEGVDLVSRLIDGQFPNYQQVLPQSHTTRAVLDREELLRAVRPALIAHESANIVKLQIGGDGESGHHRQRERRGRRPRRRRSRRPVEGDGTTIAFNARYLADVLTNVDAEQFALELNGPLSPGVFKPVGDDHYVHVVMPVRTTVLTGRVAPARSADQNRARSLPPRSRRPPRVRGARSRVRARGRSSSGARTPRARRASSRRSSCSPGAARTGPRPTAS